MTLIIYQSLLSRQGHANICLGGACMTDFYRLADVCHPLPLPLSLWLVAFLTGCQYTLSAFLIHCPFQSRGQLLDVWMIKFLEDLFLAFLSHWLPWWPLLVSERTRRLNDIIYIYICLGYNRQFSLLECFAVLVCICFCICTSVFVSVSASVFVFVSVSVFVMSGCTTGHLSVQLSQVLDVWMTGLPGCLPWLHFLQ